MTSFQRTELPTGQGLQRPVGAPKGVEEAEVYTQLGRKRAFAMGSGGCGGDDGEGGIKR
ncbi:MAG: hypothetical protein VKK97_05410 [Synechococcaceae cyanobacterium]|nr:hypothetical protein [Synechococcaceae cyanobacterium]